MVTDKDYSMVSEELTMVVQVAKEAGAAIMSIYNRVEAQDDLTIKSKEDHSPLTEADLAAHHCIMDGLKKINLKPQLSPRSLPYLLTKSVGMGALLVSRSFGWHKRIYQAQWRIHGKYCINRA